MPITGYSPSPAAVRATIDGVPVALDIYQGVNGPLGIPIGLILVEQFPNGDWDGIGANTNEWIWMGSDSTGQPLYTGGSGQYTHPDGSTMTGSFIDVVNTYRERLVTDYIPEVNKRLAVRFPGAVSTTPTENFTSVENARQYLAGLLVNYRFEGKQVVANP